MPTTPAPLLSPCEDFEGELYIAGLDQEPERVVLCNLIAKLEPEVLSEAFGYGLYKAFRDGINAGIPAQRWIDLRDGASWTGLNDTVLYSGSLKRFFVCVVYDRYWRMSVTQTTRSGEKKGRSENASDTTMRYKAVRASQEAWDHLRQLTLYLSQAKDGQGAALYPEYTAWCARPYNFTPQNIFDL